MAISKLSSHLLRSSANNRHGVVLAPQKARLSKSDIQTVSHVGVPYSLMNQWNSASGGVSFDENDAYLAAIGEGIERYCAVICHIETKNKSEIETRKLIDAEQFSLFNNDQRCETEFPFSNLYSENCGYTKVYSLADNTEHFVPQPLVVLRDDYKTGLPTSSGLAAGATTTDALLRAMQELIERDALMTMWMHSLAGRRIETPDYLKEYTHEIQSEVYVFDITPSYSPFPVVATCGIAPLRGQPRFSLGVACKDSYRAAIEKSFLEWSQGIYFVGMYTRNNDTSHLHNNFAIHSFDEHAVFYSVNAHLVESLPLLARKDEIYATPISETFHTSQDALNAGIDTLSNHGIDLFYRDLTTIDAIQSGVFVVRVISPQLVPIHADHKWPFLGGTAQNVAMRYPEEKSVSFPNHLPHPLG